jgi:hypothetical protein
VKPLDHAEATGMAYRVFQKKNEEYGDTVEQTGLLGASVEIIGGAARLQQLVLDSPDQVRFQHRKASILNVLVDLLNYAAIGMYMAQNNNLQGHQPKYRLVVERIPEESDPQPVEAWEPRSVEKNEPYYEDPINDQFDAPGMPRH